MSRSDYPKVSIITINFNQAEVTCALLATLQKVTYPEVEVIVVDNASEKDSPDPISSGFPDYKLIKSPVNLGFAGGNNLGILNSTGKYILLLNNDTEVDPGFLEPLVNRLESDLTIGMIGPKIRFHHSPDVIQYAGYTPMSRITLRQHLTGYRQKDTGQFDVPGETFATHGAAMMVPRSVIEKVGLMAEQYFLYYEEHDWCHRIREAGFRAWYEPSSLVFHKESISTGKDSPFKTYYLTRNRILFARRNFHGIEKILSLIYLGLIVMVKDSIANLVKGQIKWTRSILRGTFWHLSHFRHLKSNPDL
jgi:GT2 family glycosyltransferase